MMSTKVTNSKVTLLTGSANTLPEAMIDIGDPLRAATIALRHFRRQGHPVFAADAIVSVETGTGYHRFTVRDVIAWLKRPEQAEFLAEAESMVP